MVKMYRVALMLLLLLCLFVVSGPEVLTAEVMKVGKATVKPLVDGIDTDYPQASVMVGKASIRMAVWQDKIFVHAKMKGAGWIAIAFNKQGAGMDGANMIIGYLDAAGKGAARNDLGKGWSHAAATKQDISEFVFLKAGEESVLEFAYPLVFSPGFSIKGLDAGGTYSLLISGNENSYSISSKHTWRAKADFSL
jgi:hypothetical protein